MKKYLLITLIMTTFLLAGGLATALAAKGKSKKSLSSKRKSLTKNGKKRSASKKKRKSRKSKKLAKSNGDSSITIDRGAQIGYQAIPKSSLYDLPIIKPILARKNSVNQDLTLRFGFLPTDAFNKGVIFGATYTVFFSQYLGWEIINANYSYNIETKLKADLAKQKPPVVAGTSEFGQKLDYFESYVTTNLVYTPLYIKSLLFNRSLVHGEISFTFGGGIVNYKINGASPTVSLGLMFRFYSGLTRSFKLDFRDLVYFRKNSDPVNSFSISIGHAWHI